MRISVIVCVYNQAIWLPRCIRSILASTAMNSSYEVIIVDDCSSDGSYKEAVKFSDLFENVRVVKNDVNKGLPGSINIALMHAVGQYFIRVDSDDFVDARMLSYLSTYLDCNPHFQGVCCDYFKVNEAEEKVSRHSAQEEQIACGVMYRSEPVRQIGGYDSNFSMREGHDLRKRFLANGNQIGYLEFPFYYYRQHEHNRTITQKNELDMFDRKLKHD